MTNKLVVTINSLKVPKIKKILLYEMKFLVPNYSCFQNPWLEGYRPQIPVFSVLCPQLNLLKPPPRKKIPGYATGPLPTYFFELHLNIIFASTFNSSKPSFLRVYPPRLCMHLSLPHTCYAHRPPHPLRSYYPVNIWCDKSLEASRYVVFPSFMLLPAILNPLDLPPIS